MHSLALVVILLLEIYLIALLVRGYAKRFGVNPDLPVMRALDYLAEPLTGPLRRVTPKLEPTDPALVLAVAIVMALWLAVRFGSGIGLGGI